MAAAEYLLANYWRHGQCKLLMPVAWLMTVILGHGLPG